MGLFNLPSTLVRGIELVIKGFIAVIVTMFGWLLVGEMVAAGWLPADPLGLAAFGLPARMFGIPTVYALAILGVDLMILSADVSVSKIGSEGGGSTFRGGGGGW